MFKVRYLSPQEPVSIDRIGDKLFITININESIESEASLNENNEEIITTYYSYNSNTFNIKKDSIDLNYIKENPQIFLFYGPDFDIKRKEIVDGVQQWMDSVAQTKNYDNIFTAISYKDSTVEKFKNEAIACSNWRDEVWTNCYAILDDVIALKRELPTLNEIINELPTIKW